MNKRVKEKKKEWEVAGFHIQTRWEAIWYWIKMKWDRFGSI